MSNVFSVSFIWVYYWIGQLFQVTLATVHCASCFFPLFFPGPIIYPKTTPAPTTTEPPPPPPPPPQKIVHVYKPAHSYGHQKSHYAPQQSHYAPHKSHYGNYHHFIEYDEGYPVEEYSKEEVTEPPTTTTTTTTPKPTTKKQHHYRLVYPKPPPLFYPHFPYTHFGGGHYGGPPVHPPPSYGHYKPYGVARQAPVKVVIAEPSEESAPKPKYKKPTPPPMDGADSMEHMDSSEMKVMPMKTAYRPKYESPAPKRRPPPGYPYPDQYQIPKLRRPPPVYQVAPQRRPNIPVRPYRPPPSPPPVYEAAEEEIVEKEEVEPPRTPTTASPTMPPKIRRPPVFYVTPPTTTVSPPSVPSYEAPPAPSRLYLPPPDDFDQDTSYGPPLFNFTSPEMANVAQISRRVDTQHRRILDPPARLDGHDYEFWNKRDSIVNPQLEQPSFDTLSFNFIREMIANSTMSTITRNNG